MELKKIRIENFKSIDKIELEVNKYGPSHTTMFVGINEVGKSNILEAMSYLKVPTDSVKFKDFNNRNNQKSKYVDLYFEMTFENDNTYIESLKKELDIGDKFVKDFRISKVTKNVYLEKEKTSFQFTHSFEFKDFNITEYFLRTNVPTKKEIKHKSELIDYDENMFEKLNEEKLIEILTPYLSTVLEKYELGITFWKPEKEYLITQPINLNSFKDNFNENIPLKNIFALSEYKKQEEIKLKIEEIIDDNSLRRSLQSELTTNATKYFGNVWEHKIGIDVEITEGLQCNVTIKDNGAHNKDKYFNMNSRSQGFHQFISLILSLSIQNHSLDMRNKLILIDEPENHLHPSGIRNMMHELLKIGENNYLFLATHSCFIIDKKNKERNFIIRKDSKQNTIFSQIKEEDNIFDDEVLADAFGINIYKDFLTPHKILVEGLSDKKILLKTINKLKIPLEIGITNGYGSNILSIASRFKLEKIKTLVLLDDDSTGIENKNKIIKIGEIYSSNNVLTIRDLENKIIPNGTIEDTLGKEFVQSKLNTFWKNKFSEKLDKFSLIDSTPFVEQIKIHLMKTKPDENSDKFFEEFKTKLSEEFKPTNLDSNFPLLLNLVENIVKKLKGEIK